MDSRRPFEQEEARSRGRWDRQQGRAEAAKTLQEQIGRASVREPRAENVILLLELVRRYGDYIEEPDESAILLRTIDTLTSQTRTLWRQPQQTE